MRPRRPRAYSLNLVLILSTSLVVLVVTMLSVLGKSAQTSGDLIARKQTFFATDGMMRSVVKVASDFFRATPDADSAALSARFDASTLSTITPAGYTVETFEIETTGRTPGVVPNGAFQGMNASLFPISSALRLRKQTSLASSRQTMSSTIAQIGMFQFMVFIDGFGDWIPGPPQRVDGRAHANGDLCLASNNEFCLTKVTASGRLMHAGDGRCRHVRGDGAPFIARDATPDATCGDGGGAPTASEWGRLGAAPDRENGCSNCASSGAPWAAWARNEFASNALDVDMAVPQLKLPVTGAPLVQGGKNANNGAAANGSNSRFLVDPVLGGDPSDVRAQKYADKAHIRIINGVWYLRDPADPTSWPGEPIWSDHPGNFTLSAAAAAQPVEAALVGAKAVGQLDIRAALASRGIPWTGTMPRRFSYYESDVTATAPMLDNANTATGVVSYGTLIPLGTTPQTWAPGHWAQPSSGDLCPAAASTGGAVAFRSALSGAGVCSAGTMPVAAALLNATRSGFRDQHIQENGAAFAGAAVTAGAPMHTKVLPMNFDVAAFRAALADTSAGELGSYFCAVGGSCFMREPFNGIVWIGLTWAGSQNGFAAGATGTPPLLHPPHGEFGESTGEAGVQPAPRVATGGSSDNDAANHQLPYPLCAAPTSTLVAPSREPRTAGHNVPFKHTSCAAYGGEGGARPTAVRVTNASTVAMDYTGDGALDGLSIVTHVPMYVLGEWNTSSPLGPIDVSSAAATPWVPAMVGGDQVYLLSSAFNDASLAWDVAPPTGGPPAVHTTYNIQILAGWAESANNVYSGGVENFPRFLEDWNPAAGQQTNTINGSLVVGFNSPFYRWPRGGTPYDPPRRAWSFDRHLDVIANQPPGAPTYNVYATRAWTRR